MRSDKITTWAPWAETTSPQQQQSSLKILLLRQKVDQTDFIDFVQDYHERPDAEARKEYFPQETQDIILGIKRQEVEAPKAIKEHWKRCRNLLEIESSSPQGMKTNSPPGSLLCVTDSESATQNLSSSGEELGLSDHKSQRKLQEEGQNVPPENVM